MAKKDKAFEAKNSESSSESEIVKKFKANPLLYVGSVLILVLVIVAFVGGDLLAGGGSGNVADLTFGYYDKAPITYVPGNTLAQNYEQVARYYQSQGYDLNDFNVSAQVWRQAFESTVSRVAILQMMKRSNYEIPEKTVDRYVAQLPNFQDNGRFSPILYRQMSESSRLTLWRQVHDELMEAHYSDSFFGMLMPSAEADFIGKMSSVMRTFDMVHFNVDNYPEAEYLYYAESNPNLFQTIHLSKITVNSSEREAKKILDTIKSGVSTFEDAARAQSQDGLADRGGDMSSRYYFELEAEIPAAVRDVVFKHPKGHISDVFRIDDSWVFFRVEDEIKPANFDDEIIMAQVRSYVNRYDRGRMEDWAIAQAMDFISEAKDAGFDNAVRWWSLGKTSFGPLPINYGGVELFTSLESFSDSNFSSQYLQSLSRNENFWRIAFSTPLNTPSEPMVQGSNVLVLLPVEQIADDDTWKNISLIYSSYWLNHLSEQSLKYYFLSDSRMDDRFWDVYIRYFVP